MDKIENLIVGNLISETNFISGTKYKLVDSINYTQNNIDRTLCIGDEITTYDHDTNEYIDGPITDILIIEDGRVELILDAAYGRISITDIEW